MGKLQEKVSTLGTAIKLSSYFSGSVDTRFSGISKPKGTTSGSDLNMAAEGYTREDEKTYSILDSFVQTDAGYCKCQRGPVVSKKCIS